MESDLAFVDAALAAPADGVSAPAETVDPGNGSDSAVDDGGAVETTLNDDGTPKETPQAAEEGAEEKPAVEGEEAKPAPETEPEEDLTIEDLSVTALNKKLETNPELKKALESDPATKNLVYTALRRAAKVDKYEEMFTNPETAKFTLDTANEMVEFDRTFRSEDPKDQEQFLRALQFNSFQRDESGNVIVGQNGQPVSTGAYERLVGTYRNFLWNEVDQMAKAAGDEELAEAVRIIREKVEHVAPSGERSVAAGEEDSQLPENVRRDLQRLREYEQRDKTTSAESAQTFTKGINEDITTKLTEDIKTIIANVVSRNKVAISDYVQKNIIRDSIDTVKRNIGDNVAYKNMLSTLMQTTSRNADGRAKIVNFALGSIKQTLPRIVAATITGATQGVVASNAQKQEKIDKQAGRKEPTTTGGVKGPALPDIKTVVAEATKKKGRPLSDLELADAILSTQ